MSTTTETRLPLAVAKGLATEISALLAPACERLQVAGSIRRRRPDVGDIELVLIPRQVCVRRDLFGVCHQETDALNELCNEFAARGVLGKRLDVNGSPRWGPKAKYASFRGVNLDLFSATTDNFGLQLVLRTGPAMFNRWLVSPQRHGGAMPDDMRMEGGQLRVGLLGTVIPTPTEEELFAQLGIPYREPWEREAPAGWVPPGERMQR